MIWIGKDAVVDHHLKVPTWLLDCALKRSFGGPDAENLPVEVDDLQHLKAQRPRNLGGVNCIYIDPVYDTVNEKWVYKHHCSPSVLLEQPV